MVIISTGSRHLHFSIITVNHFNLQSLITNPLHHHFPPLIINTLQHRSQTIKMQFSSIIAIFASVALATAAASPMAHGHDSGSASIKGNCKADQKQACCKTNNSGALSGLLGGSCELNVRK